MVSLSDIVDGPKMFRETFGPKWGPRLWWIFFVIVVLGIASAAAEEIGGVGSRTVAAAREWFSPPPAISGVPAAPGDCTISNSTIYGSAKQTCTK